MYYGNLKIIAAIENFILITEILAHFDLFTSQSIPLLMETLADQALLDITIVVGTPGVVQIHTGPIYNTKSEGSKLSVWGSDSGYEQHKYKRGQRVCVYLSIYMSSILTIRYIRTKGVSVGE